MISDLESVALILDFESKSDGASLDALIMGAIRSTSCKSIGVIKSIGEGYLLVPLSLSPRYSCFFLISRSSSKYRLHSEKALYTVLCT